MSDASPNFRQAIVDAIPNLRAFAVYLTNDHSKADDLVQETLLKAWKAREGFTAGTNLKAWLFTILRNTYFSDFRKLRREVQDDTGELAGQLVAPPQQLAHLYLEDFKAALAQLPPDQREALILIGAEGLTYEEVATICDCAVGTIKSRVNRARSRMAELLSISSPQDVGEPPIVVPSLTRV